MKVIFARFLARKVVTIYPKKRVVLWFENCVLKLNRTNIVGNCDWIDGKAFFLLLDFKFFNRSELEDVFEEK